MSEAPSTIPAGAPAESSVAGLPRPAGRTAEPSPSTPDLSVIVVTHDGRELALRTLASARASTGPITVEWLLVDSGSSDGTPEALEAEFDDIRVTRCANIGFAAGNNIALRRARGRYVLLLNPDVEISHGTFGDLVHAMDLRPRVGVASVIQLAADGSLLPSIRRFPSPVRQLGEALLAWHWPRLDHLQEADKDWASYWGERSADWLVGAFLIARAEAISEAGVLDEDYFMYSEEKDWCRAFRGAGWDVRHLPVMRVVHYTGRSARPDLIARLTYSRLLYAEKHLDRRRRALIRLALVAHHGLRVLAFAAASGFTRRWRMRLAAERCGLGVALGLRRPRRPAARPAPATAAPQTDDPAG